MSTFNDQPDDEELQYDAAYADQIDRSDPLAEMDDFQNLPKIRNMEQPPRGKTRKRHTHQQAKPDHQVRAELADKEPSLEFTYNVQRDSHERIWLEDSLGGMIHLGWLSDVLRQVKGGKEASVYLCEGTHMTGEEFIAAKIYRPRMFRNLRNDSLYREGRMDLDMNGNRILDHGMQRAIKMKTEYGKRLSHTSWIEHEFRTMQILHRAGVDMPAPYARGNNVILMQYIGSQVLPAPTLNQIDLEPDEAETLFNRSLTNLDRMLACSRIHADYSAYNILYWEGKIWVIDFPQAVHPDQNRNAYDLFERDVQRISEYFAVQGVKKDPKRLAAQIWEKNRSNLSFDIDPGLLVADDEEDRGDWDSMTENPD